MDTIDVKNITDIKNYFFSTIHIPRSKVAKHSNPHLFPLNHFAGPYMMGLCNKEIMQIDTKMMVSPSPVIYLNWQWPPNILAPSVHLGGVE